MNMWLRVLWVFITSFFRPRMNSILDTASLTMHTSFGDLDTNFHMNNGRFLTIMDLGRFDLTLRSPLFRMMIETKGVPILAAMTMRFRLPLMPFEKYRLDTRIVCWDDKWAYIEQRFIKLTGAKAGAVAAIGIVRGSFYNQKTKTTIPTNDIINAIGHTQPSPPMPVYIADWVRSEDGLRTAASS